MNLNLLLLFSLLQTLPFNTMAQSSTKFEFSLKAAHPKAKALMNEDFYWSPINEMAPFGNDAGSDAAYGFYKWRKNHASDSPILYLRELIKNWKFPEISWEEMDTLKLKNYMRIPAQLTKSEIEREIQLLKQYNASPAQAGQKEISDEQIKEIVTHSQKDMGRTFLINMDQSIIGTAFAQFVLEGKIDPSLQHFAQIAFKRQMLPILIGQYPNDAQMEFKKTFTQMLNIISKANK